MQDSLYVEPPHAGFFMWRLHVQDSLCGVVVSFICQLVSQAVGQSFSQSVNPSVNEWVSERLAHSLTHYGSD